MKAILMLLLLATPAVAGTPQNLTVTSTELFDCYDDPGLKAIVCKKIVYLACPYDEHEACREIQKP